MEFQSNALAWLVGLEEGAREVVNETATDIAELTEELAPRLSGAMAASTYTLLEGENHDEAFAEAERRARALNPKVEMEPSGLEDFSGEGIHQAGVCVPVTYAPLIHNGYSSREGRPFMEEAGGQGRGGFEKRLDGLGHILGE